MQLDWHKTADGSYLACTPDTVLEVRCIDGEWHWRGQQDDCAEPGRGWGIDAEAAKDAAERWLDWRPDCTPSA